MRIGGLYDVAPGSSGAIVSYVVVGAILLLAASPPLGLVVLLGVPAAASALLGLHRPAAAAAPGRAARGVGPADHARRRHRRRPARAARHRRRADLPAPLRRQSQRRARGRRPGGRRPGRAGRRPGAAARHLRRARHLARRAVRARGRISAGELVAFYGYAAFLVIPLRTATEIADRLTRAHIGARKVLPGAAGRARRCPDAAGPAPRRRPTGALRRPELAACTVRAGRADRLVSAGPRSRPRSPTGSAGSVRRRAGVLLGGVPLADLPLATVRRRVVVSETDPRLFTGVAARASSTRRRRPRRRRAARALDGRRGARRARGAAGRGWTAQVEERGRSFSGGQRQRLALARALLADAETLVLVEPTSAVDAHTEARIAGRAWRRPGAAGPPWS